MSRLEIAALLPIRRHREAQAERAWRDARRRQEGLSAALAHAETRLHELRDAQTEQRARLAREQQGQALTPLTLAAWHEQEARLLKQLAADQAALIELREQQRLHHEQLAAAQRQLRQRQRQLEKLSELSALLSEEPDHEYS